MKLNEEKEFCLDVGPFNLLAFIGEFPLNSKNIN